MRRHRGLAAGAGLVLLTSVFALAVSTVLINRQKARADAQFHRARQAVDESFTQISEQRLLHVPGLQPLRTELLASTMKYYRDFYAEQRDDPTLELEMANTALRLGEIHAELNQSVEALKYLRDVDRIARRGIIVEPESETLMLSRARSTRLLTELQWPALDEHGQDQALRELRQVVELARRSPARNVQVESLAGSTLLASLLAERNRAGEGLLLLQEAEREIRRLMVNTTSSSTSDLLAGILSSTLR